MRRTLIIITALVLFAAACGDSEGAIGSATGDPGPLCDLAVAQDALSDDADAPAASLDPFIDVAPGSIRSDLIKVRDLFDDIETIEATGDDDAAFAALLAAGADPEMNAAFANIERFMVEECGIDAGGGGTSTAAEDVAGEEVAGTVSASCGEPGFTGTVSSEGDDSNAPFTLVDGDVSLVQAFALQRAVSYTVYLADYDLGDQLVGLDTITAAPGQVIVTVFVSTPDGESIVLGEPYETTFIIMDSGGGANGSPDDPIGTATFNGIADDRVCFDIDFSDTGQVLSGSITADVVGGF